MPSLALLNYKEVLKKLPMDKPKHLLLGNGFSRAWDNKLFAYDALFKQAEKHGLNDELKQVFTTLKTTDFEAVMRVLRQCAALISGMDNSARSLAGKLKEYADQLRELLVKTIAGNHPPRPFSVTEDQYRSCRKFLKPFSRIYTLNYDLLLYWAVMQRELEPEVNSDDGFRQPEDGPEPYVTWNIENTDEQSIFYLHGALHLFDAGHELQKYTWSNTDVALIDQIRTALKQERYPLFVSEGTAAWKLNRIQHSSYLSRGYRSFAHIGGSLVVLGHSMAEHDEHIIKLIEARTCKIGYLAVGLHGDVNSPSNTRIVNRCRSVIDKRKQVGRTTELDFYNAGSANVWSAK